MSLLIKTVVLSPEARKQLAKLPLFIVICLDQWIAAVEDRGLAEVRKVRGYHDEPLKGSWVGYRSVRLNRCYRAYYRIAGLEVRFVLVERIDKHEY